MSLSCDNDDQSSLFIRGVVMRMIGRDTEARSLGHEVEVTNVYFVSTFESQICSIHAAIMLDNVIINFANEIDDVSTRTHEFCMQAR